MGDLLERDDVDWQAVAEVHEQWKHEDSGLGPAATLVISIVAAAVTSGATSGLVSAILAKTGLEAGTALYLATQAALSASFTSLGSQLAVGVGNAAAGGDIGQTLKAMYPSKQVHLQALSQEWY